MILLRRMSWVSAMESQTWHLCHESMSSLRTLSCARGGAPRPAMMLIIGTKKGPPPIPAEVDNAEICGSLVVRSVTTLKGQHSSGHGHTDQPSRCQCRPVPNTQVVPWEFTLVVCCPAVFPIHSDSCQSYFCTAWSDAHSLPHQLSWSDRDGSQKVLYLLSRSRIAPADAAVAVRAIAPMAGSLFRMRVPRSQHFLFHAPVQDQVRFRLTMRWVFCDKSCAAARITFELCHTTDDGAGNGNPLQTPNSPQHCQA